MQFRPMKIEQTIMAMKVKEYRGGVYIGEVTRDMQIIVISCPNSNPWLSGPGQLKFCFGDTVRLNILSMDPNPHDSVKLYCYALDSMPGYSFTTEKDSLNPEGTFTWIPDTFIANKTYSFIIEAIDDACPIKGVARRKFSFEFVNSKKPDSIKIEQYNQECNDYYFHTNVWPLQYAYNIYHYLPDGDIRGSSTFYKAIYLNDIYPIHVVVNEHSSVCKFELYDTFNIQNSYDIITPDSFMWCSNTDVQIIPNQPPNTANYDYTWIYYLNNQYNSEQKQTFSKMLDSNLQIVVQAKDPDNYCNIYDTVLVKIYEDVDSITVMQDRTVCKSIDSIELVGYPKYDSSYWDGYFVYQSDSNFYFDTKNALNEKTYTFFYFPNKAICGRYDSVNIKVIDDLIDPVKDSVNLCVNQKEYALNSLYSNAAWSGNKVSNATFFNPDQDTGVYAVYFTAGDSGCRIYDTLNIYVFPQQEAVPFAVAPPFCYGDTVFLNDSLKYPNINLSNFWTISSGSGQYFYHPPKKLFAYVPHENDYMNKSVSFVLNSVNIGCPITISNLNVPIYYNPEANFYTNKTSGNVPLNVYFSDSSIAKYSTISKWQWDFGNNITAHSKNFWVTYDSAGFYTVKLIVENEGGCKDSIIKKDYINAIYVGINELKKQGINIFPNPFSTKILIKSEKPIQNIRFVNFEGKEVLYATTQETQTELSTENLAKGIYLLEIEMEAGEVFRHTLIKN